MNKDEAIRLVRIQVESNILSKKYDIWLIKRLLSALDYIEENLK